MTKQARKKKVIVEKFIKNIIKDCIKKTSINIIKACYNHIKNKVNNIQNIFLIYLIK
jgi:ribosomal protein S7